MIFLVVLIFLMIMAAASDGVVHIARCGMFKASLKATGCRLQVSVGAISPRQLP
jgi:hypothetical protein